MPNAVDLTLALGGAGGFGAGVAAVYELLRRSRREKAKDLLDKDVTDVSSWTGLTSALQEERRALQAEIQGLRTDMGDQRRRLQEEMDDQRRRLQAEMNSQREDYEERLRTANKRITDLTNELNALRRAVGMGRGGDPPEGDT